MDKKQANILMMYFDTAIFRGNRYFKSESDARKSLVLDIFSKGILFTNILINLSRWWDAMKRSRPKISFT